MAYQLFMHEDAQGEWNDLDSSIRIQLEKKLKKVLENPHVPSAALSGMKNCYKIKLRKAGVRLVYEVEDTTISVFVIAVGKRDKGAVYETAKDRL